MVKLLPDASFWRGRRVFLTGHSGFKGAWLTLWLHSLGGQVCGYSLKPDYEPNLQTILGIDKYCARVHRADIRDARKLAKAMRAFAPELVIHMAAQPLVRRSYKEPLETVAVNIDGTANVLAACRSLSSVRAALIVTTDKCYKPKKEPCREDDELGGRDLYSASKACAELITDAYRQSFFEGKVRIVTARAGNVLGGGDWSEDRLVPDAVRAFSVDKELIVRAPQSVRPWQHVAEPLLGYLMLSRALLEGGTKFHAYNFGPEADNLIEVQHVIGNFTSYMPGKWRIQAQKNAPHEAKMLALDASRAKKELRWRPSFSFEETIAHTAEWYAAYYNQEKPKALAERMLKTCGEATAKITRRKAT